MKNKQEISTIVINNVLAFMKPFASKTLLKAVSILLKPCCTITGTASVSCNDDNTYEIVISTVSGLGLLGKGVATVQIGTTIVTGVLTEPNTIYVETFTTTAGTKDVNVTVTLPTNTNGTIGVTQIFTIEDVVFPSCV